MIKNSSFSALLKIYLAVFQDFSESIKVAGNNGLDRCKSDRGVYFGAFRFWDISDHNRARFETVCLMVNCSICWEKKSYLFAEKWLGITTGAHFWRVFGN